ncbi:MAG: CHAT domain-containing tetratricopeptide repeat protein, partial [Acidobacteriota bacterium]
GRIAEDSGHLTEAQEYYKLALETYALSEGHAESPAVLGSRMNLHHKIGDLLLRLEDWGKAEEQFTISLEGALAGGMRELECRCLLGLAEVSLGRGRPEQAEMLANQALRIAEERPYEDLRWRAQLLRGKSLRAAGRTEEALRDLEFAIGSVENVRGRVPAGEIQQSFLSQRLDPYREIVGILGGMPGRSAQAAQYADRAKSLALGDYLDAGGSADASEASRQPDAAISRALPEAIVLEYFFTSDGLAAFASGAGRRVTSALGMSITAAASSVDTYLDFLRDGDQEGFERSARELCRKLVQPVLQRLGAAKKGPLIVVPDGPLHRLPFAGLIDETGRYLVENYALAYSPSRSILARCLAKDRGPAGSPNQSLLLIDGSANLGGAARELSFLAALYGGSTGFWDPRDAVASEGSVRRAEIVHFAGHADLRDGKPGLVLDSTKNASRIEASAIGAWRLDRCRLVNLAGCSTAVGPQSDGSTPWGLVPAFLNAGATSMVASLLPVNDESAERLNYYFYSCLAEKRATKAEALRHAQLTLLASSSPGRFEPASWIPFLLLGDPR